MDGGDEASLKPVAEFDPASIVRKHLTNPFLTLVEESSSELPSSDSVNPFKYNTIGRSNPFTNPNRSRNPFLDNTTDGLTSDNPDSEGLPMNGGQLNGANGSPDASIDPTPILTPTVLEDSTKPTVNKIVSNPSGYH